MKTPLICLMALSCAVSLHAETRTWTRSDGKTAELELLSVSEQDGEKVGEFKMSNGKKASLKASALSEADAKLLAEWKPPVVAGPSAFDEILKGNLEKLDGEKLRPITDFKKPAKYYVFYYTASWCGPCKKFTPSLVEFYEKNKSDLFEVVLISADRDSASMEMYAAGYKMKWPHLKFSKINEFRKEFKHPGGGIPNLVLCDLEGNIIKSSYENGGYIGPSAVMNHLGSLLSK